MSRTVLIFAAVGLVAVSACIIAYIIAVITEPSRVVFAREKPPKGDFNEKLATASWNRLPPLLTEDDVRRIWAEEWAKVNKEFANISGKYIREHLMPREPGEREDEGPHIFTL